MKITILGKGAWGKALGEILQGRGHAITWLEKGSNRIPTETEMLWIALPTQSIRDCMKALQPGLPHVPVVSLSKGIEIRTGLRVSEIVSSFLPQSPFAAVSGPSFETPAEIRANPKVIEAYLGAQAQEASHAAG